MSNGRVSALVWLEARQGAMVRRILDEAGIACAAVGCPEAGRAAEVARDMGTDVRGVRDLRAAVAPGGEAVDFVWLATGVGLRDDESGVVEALRACAGRGVKIASAEPVPSSILAPVADGTGVATSAGVTAPTWRASDGMLAGVDALASLVPVASASLVWLSPPGDGEEVGGGGGGATLAAMLLDALDMLDAIVGEPAKVDGAYVDAGVGRAGAHVRAAPGESLGGLAGAFTLNARCEDGRAATVHVSDRASAWRREVVAVGPGGMLRFSDDGLEWRGRGGEIVERAGELSPTGAVGAATNAEAALSRSLARIAAGTLASPSPAGIQRVRASAGAALLSARTGQSESPSLIARMTGA